MNSSHFDDNHPIAINTVYCIGRSYVEHIHELGNAIPDEPLVFLKPNSSIIMGDTISLPSFSNEVHHEIELVLLMSDHQTITACTVGLDLTARDVQSVCKSKGLPWLKAKGFKASCWLGTFRPYKNQPYHLSLRVNDEMRQNDSTEKMMYSFEYLVAYLDELYGLKSGDIIMTGTPAGVGKLTRGDSLTIGMNDEVYHVHVR